jgi:prophage antirepressor-like protein
MSPAVRNEKKLSLSLMFPETRHLIRVVGTLASPEWITTDICDLLGLSDITEAILRLDPDETGSVVLEHAGKPQEVLTVNEPGLYRLVLASDKPRAKTFKRWISHEVLPSIRLHGHYPPPQVPNATPIMLRELAAAIERQDRLEARQDEMVATLDFVAGKVRDLDADTGYVTVLAYARLKGMDMPRNVAQRHGMALARIHRTRRIKIGQVPDERHGKVNSYRIDVVEEYFRDVQER